MKPENFIINKKTIKTTQALILLLAIFIAALPMCKAQTTVFEDFTGGDVAGNSIVGSTPIVGGAWQGSAGGQLFEYGESSGSSSQATDYSMYTDGAARSVYGAFTSALGAGQMLTLSYNLLGFGGAWPDSGGFAGVSLYTGFVSANSDGSENGGTENEFTGEPYNANQIGLDSTVSGYQGSGNTTVPTLLTFTYVYNTGAWSFTTTGGVDMSGTGAADEAFNALQIHNGSDGDIDLDNLNVTISSVPEPSPLALVGVGIGLVLAIRAGCLNRVCKRSCMKI
jgi:hypothetical protein